jgi:hypothetical protein
MTALITDPSFQKDLLHFQIGATGGRIKLSGSSRLCPEMIIYARGFVTAGRVIDLRAGPTSRKLEARCKFTHGSLCRPVAGIAVAFISPDGMAVQWLLVLFPVRYSTVRCSYCKWVNKACYKCMGLDFYSTAFCCVAHEDCVVLVLPPH